MTSSDAPPGAGRSAGGIEVTIVSGVGRRTAEAVLAALHDGEGAGPAAGEPAGAEPTRGTT